VDAELDDFHPEGGGGDDKLTTWDATAVRQERRTRLTAFEYEGGPPDDRLGRRSGFEELRRLDELAFLIVTLLAEPTAAVAAEDRGGPTGGGVAAGRAQPTSVRPTSPRWILRAIASAQRANGPRHESASASRTQAAERLSIRSGREGGCDETAIHCR
jgi:hypothetical protein